MLISDALEEGGYSVLTAQDGANALRHLQSNLAVDLLITDVGLPGGMNGRQLADEARKHRPNLKVLFITGFVENAAVGHGHLASGMDGHGQAVRDREPCRKSQNAYRLLKRATVIAFSSEAQTGSREDNAAKRT